MAEKEQQSPYPMAPAAIGYPRSDAETSTASGELRRKKRNKCILYIVLFAIFQTGIITLFSLTVMKVRTPRFRIRSAALTNIVHGTPASPSFSATMNAELAVRNANFGRYKYSEATVEFRYRGAPAGQAIVRSSRANLRSTKGVGIAVDLTASSELASDLRAGVLAVSSVAKMSGRVEMFFVMKKKRNSVMNCTMEIVTATQQLRNIFCK